MELAHVAHRLPQVELLGMEIEAGAAFDEPRRGQQIVDQVGHAQHRGADLAGARADLLDADAIAELDQPAGMAVDDGQRRAEFVGGHRHEIALELGQMPLCRQLLLQHRGLLGKTALAHHQLDGIVAEHHRGPRHFADLVAARSVPRISMSVSLAASRCM